MEVPFGRGVTCMTRRGDETHRIFPVDSPPEPQIECNEDASGESTDE